MYHDVTDHTHSARFHVTILVNIYISHVVDSPARFTQEINLKEEEKIYHICYLVGVNFTLCLQIDYMLFSKKYLEDSALTLLLLPWKEMRNMKVNSEDFNFSIYFYDFNF